MATLHNTSSWSRAWNWRRAGWTRSRKKRLLKVVENDLREAKERYPRLWVLRKRDAVIVNVLLLTGLRVDELCSLKLSDLTLSERKGTLLVRHGKGGKQRLVNLHIEARRQLGEWLEVRPQVESDGLFVGQTGEAIKPRLVQRLVEPYANLAGLQDVTRIPCAIPMHAIYSIVVRACRRWRY